MEVDSDRDWIVVGWCWFGHKTAHPTTSILPASRARFARRARRDQAFMSADPASAASVYIRIIRGLVKSLFLWHSIMP
jgi:hypothetical protein